MAVRPELVPPELQKRMVAAFERARAERLGAQIPRQGASHAGDPWIRANTAAFLVLERERRAIATRLCRRYRRSADRYRDLVLVTKLLRLQYEHLAGRVGEQNGAPAPANGLPLGGDMPADWARPWGSGPMVELDTAFVFYRDQRDRLARHLRTPTLRRAAAAAAQRRDGILTRFEGAMGEWRPELEHGRVAGPGPGGRGAGAAIAEPAGERKRARPWASLALTRPATALALFAAVGVGTIVAETRGGGSAGSVSAASPTVASLPGPLVAVTERWLEAQPARGRGERHGGSHKPKPPAREQVADADQAVLVASQTPPAAPLPEAAPAPIAPAAPVAAPAPAPSPTPAPPPAPDEPPAPDPRPDPKPRPGPVSPLPPPVDSLPAPGSNGRGG